MKLQRRLENILEQPNYQKVFTSIIKRPAHTIKKGTILFSEGDPLNRTYCVIEGFVKLYRMSEEGKDTTAYLIGPNNMLGIRALTSPDECARHNAEAITDLKVITLSHKEYYDAAIQNPAILVDLLYVFIDRLNYTERKLEGFIYADTTARVANFLYDAAFRFGKKKNGITEIPVDLTHQRIAEFVGSFRETVTVALHHLASMKLIQANKGKITINNMKNLETYSRMGKKK